MRLRIAPFGIMFLCVSMLLSSCEYSLDSENFVDLQPPSPSHTFILNFEPAEDTINVFNTTRFEFDINTFGLDIHFVDIELAGRSFGSHKAADYFEVIPAEFTPGYHTLTMTCYTNSGTGSVADIAGYEGYAAQRQVTLLIDGRKAPELLIETSITDDGYMKLSWNKCENFNFKSYEITLNSLCTGEYIKYISDADSTFFIDSCNYGNDITYSVQTQIYTENNYTWNYPISIDAFVPELTVEEIGLEQIKVSWTKSPYNVTYKLYADNSSILDGLLFETTTETSFIIPQLGLGQSVQFSLRIDNDYREGSCCISCSPILNSTSYTSYNLGEYIISSRPIFGFNNYDNTIYGQIFDHLTAYSVSPFDILNRIKVDDFGYQGYIACPTNSSRVAALSPEKVYVFEGSDLTNPIVIDYNTWYKTITHFSISDNGTIAIAREYQYEVIDVETKGVVAHLDIAEDRYPYYSKWAKISTSRLGDYISIASQNGIDMYRFDGGAFSPFFSDNRAYYSSYFNPLINNQLLTTQNDGTLEVRTMPDFTLESTIQLPSSMIICNIDPTTGYLLLTNYQNIYVMDLSSNEIIFTLKCKQSTPKLFASRLFDGSGYTLDISNYLSR